MLKDYEKLFNNLKPPEPRGDLFDKVMQRIDRERKLVVVKRRIVIFSFSFIASLVAFVQAFKIVWNGFIESGFFEFLSLIFSDAEIVMAYWQNFGMSLLEALPVMSLIIFSAVFLVFLESLKILAKDLRFVIKSKTLIGN